MIMTIHQLVLNFHRFILASWPQLNQIMEYLDWDKDPYFIDYWLQANWELMVENQIDGGGVVLSPYGYDVAPNSRYTKVGVKETHGVFCKVKGKAEVYAFLSFTSDTGDGCKLEPPFDRVNVKSLSEGKIASFYLSEVDFFLEKIE